MPAGAVGTCWAADSWPDTAWEAGAWTDAVESALAFVLDLNTRLLVYLRDHFSAPSGELTTLTTRYLHTLSGDFTARFQRLIKDATDAMS